MKSKTKSKDHESRNLLYILVAISVAFAWTLTPLFSAILWAVAISILFHPLQIRLNAYLKNPGLTAIFTLLAAIIIIALPLFGILLTAVNEATQLIHSVQEQNLDLDEYLKKIQANTPILSDQVKTIDTETIKAQLEKFSTALAEYTTKWSFNFGQHTVSFFVNTIVCLYLAFFFLRDGSRIAKYMRITVPLSEKNLDKLFIRFIEVTRSTIKNGLLVAIIQGILGAVIFIALDLASPILWACLMAIASLMPVAGTSIVWLPISGFLFITGDVAGSISLILYGIVVIGLSDNLIRSMLVGHDVKVPDYVILASTLGSILLVGVNGFVLGPLIAVLFFTLWSLYVHHHNSNSALY